MKTISNEQYTKEEAQRVIRDIIKDEEVNKKVEKETNSKCEIMWANLIIIISQLLIYEMTKIIIKKLYLSGLTTQLHLFGFKYHFSSILIYL